MGLFVSDNFVDTPGTPLTSHPIAQGGNWVQHPVLNGGTATIGPSGDVYGNTANPGVLYAPVNPSVGDYTVQTTVVLTSNGINCDTGPAARIDPTNDTMYVVAIENNSLLRLLKRVAGVVTTVTTSALTLTLNSPSVIALTVSGTSPVSLKVTQDGTTVIGPINDSGTMVTAPGKAGLFIFSNGTASSTTTGLHLRAFSATDTSGITITKPVPFQVIQRIRQQGSITITGSHNDPSPHNIEASFNGGPFSTIATNVASGPFSGTLASQAQGQGTLTVRFVDNTSVFATVATLGIGDIFLIAGQSNASGQANNNQAYQHPVLKASLFAKSYIWGELLDPVNSSVGQIDVANNDSNPGNVTGAAGGYGGSYWPLLATEIMANLSIPVAFVPCSLDATTISQWQPGSNHLDRATLYGCMIYRGQQVGGVKAVLWHQGEGDGLAGNSTASYVAGMHGLAASIQADLGVPLIVAKLQNCFGIPAANQAAINAAITQEWASDPNVQPGPDFSDIATNPDLYHFKQDAQVRVAAVRWWAALFTIFYSPAAKGSVGQVVTYIPQG